MYSDTQMSEWHLNRSNPPVHNELASVEAQVEWSKSRQMLKQDVLDQSIQMIRCVVESFRQAFLSMRENHCRCWMRNACSHHSGDHTYSEKILTRFNGDVSECCCMNQYKHQHTVVFAHALQVQSSQTRQIWPSTQWKWRCMPINGQCFNVVQWQDVQELIKLITEHGG